MVQTHKNNQIFIMVLMISSKLVSIMHTATQNYDLITPTSYYTWLSELIIYL